MRILRAALIALLVAVAADLGVPAGSFAQVGISVAIAPPPLPVYAQPPIPGPGYIWTPGYWAYGVAGYYWVPGTWVLPPAVGLLWTPGYWGWGTGGFLFHAGFWGPTVGFYGGINYGFGYFGAGFAGGFWRNGAFFYNRAVTNISNTRITNVFNRSVTVNRTNNVSFNGGAGGTTARPTQAELAAARDRREGPTAAQVQHREAASKNRALLASENHGKPPIAATARAGEFSGRGIGAARGTAEAQPAARAEQRPATGAEKRPAPGAEQRPTGRIPAEQRHDTGERAAPQPAARPPAEQPHAAQERTAPRARAEQRSAAQEHSASHARAEQRHATRQRAVSHARPERHAAHQRASAPHGGAGQRHAARERASVPRGGAGHAARERAAPRPAAHARAEQRQARR